MGSDSDSADELRQMILQSFPFDINCPGGRNIEDAIDYVNGDKDKDWISSFEDHMIGKCLVCSARVGGLRSIEKEESTDLSGLNAIMEFFKETGGNLFIGLIKEKWKSLQQDFPGQTICIYIRGEYDINIWPYKAGRQSPVDGDIWAEEREIPKPRLFIYIPRSDAVA